MAGNKLCLLSLFLHQRPDTAAKNPWQLNDESSFKNQHSPMGGWSLTGLSFFADTPMRLSSAAGQTLTRLPTTTVGHPVTRRQLSSRDLCRPLDGDTIAVGCLFPTTVSVVGQWDRLIHGYQVTHLGPRGHGHMTTLQ